MTNPTILSAALFEREERVLTAHRKAGCPPFAGQWLLPMTPVRPVETAEDAVKRYTREQFGVDVTCESFVETVYLEDPDDRTQYVTNIFRAELSGGPVRFRADGDYDDARWLASADLAQLWMPPALRDPLVRIMTDREYEPETDWTAPPGEAEARSAPATDALPLAERHDETASLNAASAPDNRAAWEAIAQAYQDERYGDRFDGRLMWSWRASEDELDVLGDIRNKHALVLGCGGGQDVVALCKRGAIAIGIDASHEQIAYARKHATKHDASNASFVEGRIEDLSRFDEKSFDLAVSIHALDYVDDVTSVLAETARVLKDGSALAIAVKHPFDVRIDADGARFVVSSPYWTRERDWTWEFKNATGQFRSYFRTMQDWFDAISNSGFVIERVIEPKEDQLAKAEGDVLDDRWMALLPYTLIIKARKR